MIEKIVGVQRAIPEELPGRAVKVVRAAFGNDVYAGAGVPSYSASYCDVWILNS